MTGATVFGEPVIEGFEHRFVGELVHSERSAHQQIDVYDHPHFGRVLTLDGLVQTTQRDEFCYHEMLVHPSLCARRPKDVLVVGGGDGGTLRHVLAHGPQSVVTCELDEAVVRVSREHLPALSAGSFDDPRSRLVFDDGAAFVRGHTDAFDAIIVDSTDPIGPAAVLISSDFYRDCRRALRADGVLVAQTGSPVYQTDELSQAAGNMRAVFDETETYLGFVPTYPGVLWSFTCASLGEPISAASGVAETLEERAISTRFYNPDVHRSAFVLPTFVADLLTDVERAPVVPGG